MKLPALGETNSSKAPISSSGSPKRCIGVCRMMLSIRSWSSSLRFCSAGKKPGQMALTRTPLRAELLGDVAREVQHARLRGRIGEHPRQRQVRGDAADVDDRPAAGLDHVPAEDLAGLEHGLAG